MAKMKKNYKRWLFVLLIMICFTVGCSSNNLEQEAKNFIVDNNYNVIYSDLNNVINEIQMFPTKDKEEKFIYYVEAIKENYSKFTNDELNNISNLLSFEYSFNFNELGYTVNDFDNDQNIIKGYIK